MKKRKVKAWRIHREDIRWWVEQSIIEVRSWSTNDYMVGIDLSQQPGWCNVVISAKEALFEDSANGIRF